MSKELNNEEIVKEYFFGCELLIDSEEDEVTKESIISALENYVYEDEYTVSKDILTINKVVKQYFDDEQTTFDFKLDDIRFIYKVSGNVLSIVTKDLSIYEIRFNSYHGIEYTWIEVSSIDDFIRLLTEGELDW